MGSLVYDFLTESFLFDQTRHEDGFEGTSDAELIEELQRYRDFCIRNLDGLTYETVDAPSALRIFAGLNEVGLQTLKQSALYITQYVLPDPLFPFSETTFSGSGAAASYLGYLNSGFDRAGLVAALNRMKVLTPMVAANYVKFLPVSLLFEAPKETPVYFSPNHFSDILPARALRFMQERSVVRSLRQNSDRDGWVVEDTLTPTRGILVDFKEHVDPPSYVYHLLQTQVATVDDDINRVHFSQHLPSEPPSPELFEVWVKQSVNKSAGDLFTRTHTQFTMSGELGMSFLTRSPFVNDLLTSFFPTQNDSSARTANIVLNVDIPFLDNISTEDLMRVRREDGEAFEDFRNELTIRLWDVQSESDAAVRNKKAQEVFHDLGRVQTHRLGMKARDLKKGALSQVAILTAGLIGSILTSSAPAVPVTIAGVAALAGAAKLAQDYRAAMRSNPAFFLWKSMNS